MRRVRSALLMVPLTLSAACAEDPVVFPGGGDDTGGGGPGCDGSGWQQVGDLFVDPETCLAWTLPSAPMTWHEAVSPSDADDGGCGSTCDEAASPDHCADLAPIEGIDGWRLPALTTLSDLAVRGPPFDDLAGDLWSRTTHDAMDALAWTVDLAQPGQELGLDKSSSALVRCVASAEHADF